ncbi:carboxymuconolactone decarboxylase family protein [Asaia sp. VD9]|uniref:carboxymuconolactone decarboxylase family protein n=1 Tax=Asaia sp. VD9 TaxID=3081235 RepID=UPI003018D109
MTQRLDYEALAPEAVSTLGEVYLYVARSGLDGGLVELVYLRISQINGCAYCLDLHSQALLTRRVPSRKLAVLQVWREAEGFFSARETAALAWAETVTCVRESGIPDGEFQRLSGIFTEEEIVDLTVAVGMMNLFNRLAIGFRRAPAPLMKQEAG